MNKKYIIAIDLHGTLLNRDWSISGSLVPPLVSLMKKAKNIADFYTCTGNDLTFVKKHLPKKVFDCFDGFVLETGCVVSDGREEKIITKDKEVEIIKELEKELKKQEFKELNYFARRLSSISLFTKRPYDKNIPRDFYPIVNTKIKELGFENHVFATYSSVAVDIVPKGYNKFTGIKFMAKNKETIGIADSMNDKHLLLDSDYGFMPSNAPPELIGLLKKNGKNISNIDDSVSIRKNCVIQSNKEDTRAVLEVLDFLNKNIGK